MIKIKIKDIWFKEIVEGRKTIEGRKGPRERWEQGNRIEFMNDSSPGETIIKDIVAIRDYDTIEEYINSEGLQNISGGIIDSPQLMKEIYNQFYSDSIIASVKMCAIELR